MVAVLVPVAVVVAVVPGVRTGTCLGVACAVPRGGVRRPRGTRRWRSTAPMTGHVGRERWRRRSPAVRWTLQDAETALILHTCSTRTSGRLHRLASSPTSHILGNCRPFTRWLGADLSREPFPSGSDISRGGLTCSSAERPQIDTILVQLMNVQFSAHTKIVR